jgi:hypothetical protein
MATALVWGKHGESGLALQMFVMCENFTICQLRAVEWWVVNVLRACSKNTAFDEKRSKVRDPLDVQD